MRENHQLVLVKGEFGRGDRSVRDEISAVFEQVLEHPVQIDDNTNIVEDLGMDSLGVMNFVMAIEDRYDISIPLDRIAQVETIGDLIHAVEDMRKGAPA
ncbi:MAG: acyl carrier protein [Caulobacteraceae bacterium]